MKKRIRPFTVPDKRCFYIRWEMILDNDGNMILTEGLVLQDAVIWKRFLNRDIIPGNNSSELYFEEKDIDGFVKKLEMLYPDIPRRGWPPPL